MNNTSYKHKIVSRERGIELIKEGYFALDPHCHSSYSYDVPDVKETGPENIIRAQKLKGLKTILTDHDTLNGHNYLKNKGEITVPAVELTFKPKIARKIVSYRPIQTLHINVFRLKDKDLVNLKKIAETGDLDVLIKYFKQHDLDWMYNHPFYHDKSEKLNWKVIPALAQNYFEVIELNSSYSKGFNDITERLAESLSKGIVASSDSHTGAPGRGMVIAKGKNFKEFWKNVKEGNAYVVRENMGTWDIVSEASLIINQAFKVRINPRQGRGYTPATDVERFDKILGSVTKGRLKKRYLAKKILQMILQSLNYIAVPLFAWRLHVTRDENRAQSIRNKMHSLTNNIKNNEVSTRLRTLENKIIHHKKKHRPKYYGDNSIN